MREYRQSATLFCAAVLGLLIAAAAHGLEAGAAKVDITPPVSTPLNGYGDRIGRDSVGVHDPLWARCVYLNDGTTAVFLVTTDLCYIPRALRRRVLELAPETAPREHIILTATHTHNGPGAMEDRLLYRFVSGRYVPEVLEATARAIVQAMNEAYNARRRAGIAYGTAKQTALSENRRIPKGPIDEQVGVIRVDDSDGNPLAIIANFAAHPTIVPETDHYSFSCDYPGYFYTELESLTSPGCVAMFMNGAEGDQRPASPEGRAGWDRVEAVGRLLAARVKEVVNGLICGEGALHVGYTVATLPPTLADAVQPGDVFLQTLEINDLLLTFFPGEPCVEIGLEMRRRALARGYKAQFTVGLANDYVNYFVPRKTYHRFDYECGMNFYGPGIEDWFYREFSKLMTRGEPEPDQPPIEAAELRDFAGVRHIVLEGTGFEMGARRGAALKASYAEDFRRRVLAPVASRAVLPDTSFWGWAPPFLDVTPIALTVLGVRARTLLAGLSEETFAEIEGTAHGAALPFDAVWLLQHAHYLDGWRKQDAFFATPFCTMFAATGDRAGADDLLIGRNLDWPDNEPPMIIEMQSAQGRRFVSVGFSWSAGAYTGMNDAGIVVAVERMPLLGDPPYEGVSVEMLARDVLAAATDFESALERLRDAKHIRGFHVLIAGPATSAPAAAIIEYGSEMHVRGPEDGLLLGALPHSATLDDDGNARYARVRELLEAERIIDRAEIEAALGDAAVTQTARARIWNETTRHSVVFEPLQRRLHVAFPGPDGRPGTYTTLTLRRSEQP